MGERQDCRLLPDKKIHPCSNVFLVFTSAVGPQCNDDIINIILCLLMPNGKRVKRTLFRVCKCH